MTTERSERIPQLTLGWRLRMSMEAAGVSRDAAAELMEVSRSTISRWCADKGTAPRRPYLAQWALMTGVPIGWLTDGDSESDSPTPTPPGVPASDRQAALQRLAASKRPHGSARRSTDEYLQDAA